MDPKILDNIQQQSKRLLEQLNDLEEYKNELDPEEYQQMKQDTLQQLEIFQTKLIEIQHGDLTLKNTIQQQQEDIQKAIKKSFNADEIKNLMSSSQAAQIREKIKKIEQDYQFKKINQQKFVQDTLSNINTLSDLGIELNANEKLFLNQNTGKANFVQNEKDVQGNALLKSAEQQLADQLK